MGTLRFPWYLISCLHLLSYFIHPKVISQISEPWTVNKKLVNLVNPCTTDPNHTFKANYKHFSGDHVGWVYKLWSFGTLSKVRFFRTISGVIFLNFCAKKCLVYFKNPNFGSSFNLVLLKNYGWRNSQTKLILMKYVYFFYILVNYGVFLALLTREKSSFLPGFVCSPMTENSEATNSPTFLDVEHLNDLASLYIPISPTQKFLEKIAISDFSLGKFHISF